MNPPDHVKTLLERLSAEWPADGSLVERIMQEIESTPRKKNRSSGLRKLSTVQRIAIGGIGLAAAAVLTLVGLTVGSAQPATAMERMIDQLRRVTSFQYTLNDKNTFTREGAERPVTVDYLGTVSWQAPGSLREEARIIEYDPARPAGNRDNKVLADFVTIHRADQAGMILDHLERTARRVAEFDGDFGDSSPVTRLMKVKDQSGEIVRDLGSKLIAGKQASGFVMKLHGAAENSGFDALEAWVDPQTDLPLELGFEIRTEGGSKSFRLFGCRWNVDLDPQLFEVRAPAGYTEVAPLAEE